VAANQLNGANIMAHRNARQNDRTTTTGKYGQVAFTADRPTRQRTGDQPTTTDADYGPAPGVGAGFGKAGGTNKISPARLRG
jgi:hypothetical protein